jgi:hypothetical protein
MWHHLGIPRSETEMRSKVTVLGALLALSITAFSRCAPPPAPNTATPEPSAPPPSVQPESSAPKEPSSPWNYSTSKDEMSGKESKFASTTSVNSVEFAFPYGGEQNGTLLVIDNSTVLFYVKRGQLVCQGLSEFGTCVVEVKFDDEKPKYVTARTSGNDQTTIAFTERGFLARLKKSNEFMVRPTVYQNGYPVFRFETAGLEDRKSESAKKRQ